MAFSKKVDFYTDPDCKDNTSTNAPVNKAYSPYCPETDFRLPWPQFYSHMRIFDSELWKRRRNIDLGLVK